MKQEQFEVRSKRAAEELFVISPTDTKNAWRVRSAHNPTQHYLVSGDGEGLRCDCPDYQTHSDDPEWSCKHMLAVENYQKRAAGTQNPESYEDEERAAIR